MLLSQQYSGNRHLYISWDAAVWHRSKILKEHLNHINSDDYILLHGTPVVKLAPLPTSAQFLNIIESVFSGLAKSVIHNSDYGSVEECQGAIDRYFQERNRHFLTHPKKAGNTSGVKNWLSLYLTKRITVIRRSEDIPHVRLLKSTQKLHQIAPFFAP